MEITVETVPEKKEEKEVSEKIKDVVRDRSELVAKYFGEEPRSVNVKLYFSTGSLKGALDPNDEGLGVFSGYVDGSDDILVAHPSPLEPVFGESLDKQMVVFIDYALVKFYFCKKYFPDRESFKLYYKYLSEYLSSMYSGNFKDSVAEFEIKSFKEDRNYKKEKEVMMAFYVMTQLSGIEFIFENLDKIVKDEDIKKSVKDIYHKELTDLIKQYQRKIEEKEKEMKKVK